MKKRILFLIAAGLAAVCVFGCADKKGKPQSTARRQEAPAITIPERRPIAVGETVIRDDVSSFQVESVRMTEKVVPPSPTYVYSCYRAETGRTYVDVCFAYQNLRAESVTVRNAFQAELYASGRYRYDGILCAETDSRSDFSSGSTSLIPLSTEYVHCLAEIPSVAADGDCRLEAIVTVDGTPYSVLVRDGGTGVLDAAEDAKEAASGAIEAGETVLIPDTCTFRIEYARFTPDLRPPNPDDYVFYYKADDGKIYLDLCVTYRNLMPETADVKKTVETKMTYAGKYEYTCGTFLEEDRGTSISQAWSVSIAPLCEETIHYLFEVPVSVSESTEPVTISLRIANVPYVLNVR